MHAVYVSYLIEFRLLKMLLLFSNLNITKKLDKYFYNSLLIFSYISYIKRRIHTLWILPELQAGYRVEGGVGEEEEKY